VVEVPIYVDGNGLHPETIGSLPTQCAALNKTNINVQELVVEAALKGDKQAALTNCSKPSGPGCQSFKG